MSVRDFLVTNLKLHKPLQKVRDRAGPGNLIIEFTTQSEPIAHNNEYNKMMVDRKNTSRCQALFIYLIKIKSFQNLHSIIS